MAKNYENEIEQLTAKLTLEEKIIMLHGCGLFRTGEVDRLGIPSIRMSDGPMGVRQEFPDANWIPCGLSDDYVSYLPSNSALAATWNPERAYAGGQVLGEEARGRGKDIIEFLHIGRGQRRNLFAANEGLDLIFYHGAIGIQRAFSNCEYHILVQPFVEPLAQRHA